MQIRPKALSLHPLSERERARRAAGCGKISQKSLADSEILLNFASAFPQRVGGDEEAIFDRLTINNEVVQERRHEILI